MVMTVNRASVIEHLRKKSKLPKKEIADVYDELVTLVARQVKRGAVLPGFGKVTLATLAATAAPPRSPTKPVKVSMAEVTGKPEALTRKHIRQAFEAWQKDRARQHLSLFIAGLKSSSSDVREAAMSALSAVGPTARPLLVDALKDKAALWPSLRILHELGDPKARSAVKRLLGHTDHSIRHLAFRTLSKIEGQAPQEEAWSREIMTTGSLPSLTTIIHGTWAEDAEWWRWPSEFPRYLDSLTHDFYKGADPFQWTGGNSPQDREKSARDLVTWLKVHPVSRVTLIAHSHGGNVIFKATELAQPGEIYIARLIFLGTPIRDDYSPDLNKIGSIINVYSEDDDIQWYGTWTPDLEKHIRNGGRTLPQGPQVKNREVSTTTDNPHFELHTAALWRREGLGSLLMSV